MQLYEKFLRPSLPKMFYWFNEPLKYELGEGLVIFTDEKTDFWQRTHYEFQRDSGHCLFVRKNGDFSIKTQVEFFPQQQYDQCGLMIRLDSDNWIKLSTEYENEQHSRLGSVVTNLGYSDWASQDISSDHQKMWYRINKNGKDFLLEQSYDGRNWQQLRIAHLLSTFETLEIGVYACSPIGKDFCCKFRELEIGDCTWS